MKVVGNEITNIKIYFTDSDLNSHSSYKYASIEVAISRFLCYKFQKSYAGISYQFTVWELKFASNLLHKSNKKLYVHAILLCVIIIQNLVQFNVYL